MDIPRKLVNWSEEKRLNQPQETYSPNPICTFSLFAYTKSDPEKKKLLKHIFMEVNEWVITYPKNGGYKLGTLVVF